MPGSASEPHTYQTKRALTAPATHGAQVCDNARSSQIGAWSDRARVSLATHPNTTKGAIMDSTTASSRKTGSVIASESALITERPLPRRYQQSHRVLADRCGRGHVAGGLCTDWRWNRCWSYHHGARGCEAALFAEASSAQDGNANRQGSRTDSSRAERFTFDAPCWRSTNVMGTS